MNVSIKLPSRWQEPSFKVVYPEDCKKIADICKEHDLILTDKETDYIWSTISEFKFSSGWLTEELRKMLNVNVWSEIFYFLEKEKGLSVEFCDELLQEEYEQ